ncbi:MAG: hypothetical protein V1492_02320 [Candidatus Micrarchaeota archaeon]
MDPATFVTQLLSNYIWFAIAGFSIATILTAIVYMFGSALMNDKIKVWAKMELTEIFYSAVILVFAFGFIASANTIVTTALGVGGGAQAWLKINTPAGIVEKNVDICTNDALMNKQPGYENVSACHIRLSIYYLRTIYDECRSFGQGMLATYSWTSLGAETAITVQTLFEKSGFEMWSPWKGFFTMRNQVIETIFNWNITVMFLTKFQEIVIRFFANAGFPLFFVAGVLLRTFSFTRRLGGMLIAIAIAMYFIYPALYAFGGLLVMDLKQQVLLTKGWATNTTINPTGNHDPPIMNTIYIEEGKNKTLGGITILEDYSKTRDLENNLSRMTEDEKEEFYRNEALKPSFDLGKRVDDVGSQEGLLLKAATWALETFKYYMTHNLFVSSVHEWRPNGHIEVAARLTFFSLFFALFGLIGTIAATRTLAETFGGDVELAGLTRLI